MDSTWKHGDPEKGDEGVVTAHAIKDLSTDPPNTSRAESIVAATLHDERYDTTQRGLKSRHAQMIALGGSIGTGYI